MQNRLVSIEFLGIPGAGKTHVLKKTAAYLRKHGKHAYSLEEAVYQTFKRSHASLLLMLCARLFPYRLGYHLLSRFPRAADDLFYLAFQRFLLAHPALSQLVLDAHYQQASTVAQFNFLSLLWCVELFSKYQLVTEELASTEAFVLFDEGFAQRVITLFGYGEQAGNLSQTVADMMASYIVNIPCPQVIFVIQASVKTVACRLKARGYPLRMQAMTPPEREQFLRRAAACVAIAVERLRQSGATLIELDNSGTDEDLLVQLQHVLPTVLIA